MNVTIIDYGSGNLRSAAKSLEKAANDTGHNVLVTNQTKDLEEATHIVLPGVGAFGDCIDGLSSIPGMRDTLTRLVQEEKRPFLGICIGMQLLANAGYEHGEHQGFGWIEGTVEAIKPKNDSLKIPHMGWNELQVEKTHPVFENISSGEHAYFVHSYHFLCKNPENIIAQVDYGGPITAAVTNENIVATQFHPEKSQEVGHKLLYNFLKWKP